MELFQLILLAVTTPFALIWLFLAAAKGKKYRQYTNSAFAREFQMSDLFCVGFSVMEILHISTKSRRAQAKIKEISEIKGKTVCRILLFYSAGSKTNLYIYHFDICLSSGCACCQRGGVASGIITGRTGNRLSGFVFTG